MKFDLRCTSFGFSVERETETEDVINSVKFIGKAADL